MTPENLRGFGSLSRLVISVGSCFARVTAGLNMTVFGEEAPEVASELEGESEVLVVAPGEARLWRCMFCVTLLIGLGVCRLGGGS